jgi:sugar porter (SP) family MFS transporter
MKSNQFIVLIALIVALGGLLMGFDASVISGVNKFVQIDFDLTDGELGLSVGSLTFVAAVAMIFAGPISDKYSRRLVLKACAVIFTVSAVGSALAPNFALFLAFRMLGGIGVGASLILAPMYIAEIAPPSIRGRMVSFNQLNIVVGISLAFFTNYLILSLGDSEETWVEALGIAEHNWRWMLGLEAIPAVLYFFGLFLVPRSPRWLMMKGEYDEALRCMKLFRDEEAAKKDINSVKKALEADQNKEKTPLTAIFKPSVRLVLTIGIVVAVLQQITGINSVFFYAPMIFEQAGGGTDAAFRQAIIVGITNLIFTIVAMAVIDNLGRKKLLAVGVTGVAVFMFIIGFGFSQATYELKNETLAALTVDIDKTKLQPLADISFENDVAYKNALKETLGKDKAKVYESELITAAIDIDANLILIGIIGFIASFAISLGPVMWVLFSELFPLSIKAVAISFVGFINSMVSAGVQSIFPWELSTIGSSATFTIYGVFALLGLIFILKYIPETKGKSLEELEQMLVKK